MDITRVWLLILGTEYAAAFFLLADHLQDAVNVCLNQIKDLQLAIAIARVYEGDTGIVLKRLLENEVLAVAAKEGNRWLASWAFWMLKRRDMAVRALIVRPTPPLPASLPPSTSIKARRRSPETNCEYLDARLHAPGNPGLHGPQGEALPHRRPGPDHPVLAAAAAEPADAPRRVEGHAAGGVGLRRPQRGAVRPHGM